MPDLIESQEEENRALVLEVLGDAQQSATEIAVSAGISLSATSRALDLLQLSGRVMRIMDGDTAIWSRT